MFGDNKRDLYSTGSYGRDVGVGLASALQNAFSQPGKYYTKANWRGNGLANVDIGYLQNDDYVNPYDFMNALTSTMMKQENYKPFKDEQQRADELVNKPMFQDLLNRSKAQYPLQTTMYNLSQIGNVGGGTIGRTNGAYDSFYNYNLPTQPISLNKFWER